MDAAQLAALQPYWREPDEAPGLTEEERQALAADMMPASALAAGRRVADMFGKVALVLAIIGLLMGASGAGLVWMSGDANVGPGVPLVLIGGVIFIPSFLAAVGTLFTRRKYKPTALKRITDRLVDVRRVRRTSGPTSHQPLVLGFASGTRIELPMFAYELSDAFVPGGMYRVWYVPSNGFIEHMLVYVDIPS